MSSNNRNNQDNKASGHSGKGVPSPRQGPPGSSHRELDGWRLLASVLPRATYLAGQMNH